MFWMREKEKFIGLRLFLNKNMKKQTNNIVSAAAIIGVFSLLSRLLGLIRDRILASQFGAGDILDIYYAAFRIPDFIYSLIVLGALSAGLIPILSESFLKNKEEGWRRVNNILNIVLFFVLVSSISGFILIPLIMPFLVPGFSEAKIQEVVSLSRIILLSPIFLTGGAIFGSAMQARKRFLLYSISPMIYNLGIIGGALFLTAPLGIKGLAAGVVLGSFGHMLIQWFGALNMGYRYQRYWHWADSAIQDLWRLGIPRILTLAASQINWFAITFIASTLTVGSLTIFNLANNLQFLPIGIFGLSFAIASFPTLSEDAARKNYQTFTEHISHSPSQILFYIIPASVFMTVSNAPIVRVVLGAGRFNWEDTILTAEALRIFCVSLFAQALIFLFVRAFFALKNTRAPFTCALISVLINIILAWYLSSRLGILGVVLAFSAANIIQLILLHLFLSHHLGGLGEKKMAVNIIKVMIASLTLAVITQWAKIAIGPWLNFQTFQGIFLHGAISGAFGIVSFFLMAEWLKIPEYVNLKSSFKEKLQSYSASQDGSGL